MRTKALDVAKYLIATCAKRGQPLSNLKLQKLLYYAQGWYLGITKKPLFDERIEAWVHGPVVPDVFRQYRTFRWSPIVGVEAVGLPKPVIDHLDAILCAYGHFSAAQLEQISHTEAPWLEARGDLPPNVPCTALITHESMQKYFGQHMANG